MRLHRSRRPSDPPPASPAKTFMKVAALYAGVTVVTSLICYNGLSNKTAREAVSIRLAKERNHLHMNHEGRYHAFTLLNRSLGDDREYRKALAEGGNALGDLEWITLLTAFHDRHIPFTNPYMDAKDRYLLGKGMAALAAKDNGLASDIARWKSVRDDVLRQGGHTASEKRFMSHVATEQVIETDSKQVSKDLRMLKPKSFVYGLITSTVIFALTQVISLIVVSLSLLKERIKVLLARKQTPEEKPVEAEKPQEKPANGRKDQTPTKLEPLNGTCRRAMGANGSTDVVNHLPDARKRMEADFGSDFTAAVFKVLNGKLSNTLAKKVAHGNYEELRKLMLSSRKAFGVAGYDFETLERVLMPKHSLVPQYDTEKQVAFSRKRHVLDDIKRWGWAPNDFHRLLAEYGFDTSEVGGGGHCFVKYNGQKLRYSSGRFVIVPHRTTGKEITPGAAGKILKGCADFLVMHERVADAQPDEA